MKCTIEVRGAYGTTLSRAPQHLDLLFEAVAQFHFDAFGIVMGLDPGSEFDGGSEIAGQAQGGVGLVFSETSGSFSRGHLVSPSSRPSPRGEKEKNRGFPCYFRK